MRSEPKGEGGAPGPPDPPPFSVASASENEIRGVFEEFNALREEINNRTGLQHQLVSFTLAGTGTFVTLSVQNDAPGAVAMGYPFLAAFLAAGWLRHHYDIHRIGRYIRKRLEPQPLGLQWETYKSSRHMPVPTEGAILSAGGVFVCTQTLLLGIGVMRAWGTPTLLDWVLGALDVAATVTTLVLMVRGERVARAGAAEAAPSPFRTG